MRIRSTRWGNAYVRNGLKSAQCRFNAHHGSPIITQVIFERLQRDNVLRYLNPYRMSDLKAIISLLIASKDPPVLDKVGIDSGPTPGARRPPRRSLDARSTPRMTSSRSCGSGRTNSSSPATLFSRTGKT